MHRPLLLLIVSIILLSGPTYAQIHYDSIAIKILLSDTSSYSRNYSRSSLIWDEFAKRSGNVLKLDRRLLFIPDHFGVVFEASQIDSGLLVKRLDQTQFSGLTGNQYCFYNDHLYSFGGYGYWQTNGQLRMYQGDKKEWDIVKLNEVVPSGNLMTYFDPKQGYLWCCRQDHINEVLSSDKFQTGFDAYRLDLATAKWEKVGNLTYRPTNTPVQEGFFLETPKGVIVNVGGPRFELWDLNGNARFDIGGISDSLRVHFIDKLTSIQYSLFYLNGQAVIYDHLGQKVFKIFKFPKEPLKRTGQVFTTSSTGFSDWKWLFFAIPVLLAVWLLWRRMRKKSIGISADNTNLPDLLETFLLDLSNQESEVLLYIIADSAKGNKTQAQDINRILGTESKSADVQKKHRSDVILSINRKFLKFSGTGVSLVEKYRVESDKRLFEYAINQKFKIPVSV